jgi:hypothetical protein
MKARLSFRLIVCYEAPWPNVGLIRNLSEPLALLTHHRRVIASQCVFEEVVYHFVYVGEGSESLSLFDGGVVRGK